MLRAGQVEVAKPQPALSGLRRGREKGVGTQAKAPGRRKSVLGKVTNGTLGEGNDMSPAPALGLARLQGGRRLGELTDGKVDCVVEGGDKWEKRWEPAMQRQEAGTKLLQCPDERW